MTFSDMKKLTRAIDDIETWAHAVGTESEQDEPDYEKLVRFNKYLDEAKQAAFEICIK